MGRDVFDASPAARAIFRRADDALGVSLTHLCFEGPEDELRKTINAQPAIVTVSVALLEAARERDHTLVQSRPAYVAGHSLGEYSALIAAGVLPFEQGVQLVRERGRLMQIAGERNPGTMAAIMGLEESIVQEVCEESGAEISNLNGAGQIVIGGHRPAVIRAMDLARARGAAKVIELSVSGAFHSSLMQTAVPGMAEAVAAIDFRDPEVPVIANATAEPLTTGAAIKEELLRQLTTAVQWQRSIELLARHGITAVAEIGPGRVLAGLIKRIARGVQIHNLNSAKAVQSDEA
ncbi:MAG: ACP S-malonyltransferase [Chloroflexi bacterium]|nr:ACP S-malonyltransferase [Chloroflexota bacterium]